MTKVPPPGQVTVPALVSTLYKYLVAPPLKLNNPLVATVEAFPVKVPFDQSTVAPPATVKPKMLPPLQFTRPPLTTTRLPLTPPPQLNRPLTVKLPLSRLPAKVRLVIVPP